ncbi:peroxidase 5-like [Hibiscus syriacus]|uniref:Peroxidase 5-like n=1 Tax=Hibiscus syriacus TaxID=106335 RepID=A0A6A3C9Y1_HIBSY|nr:peroxidase 5-like [Hibiscus syriacus]
MVDPANVRAIEFNALLEAEKVAEATKQAIKRKIAQAASVDFQSRSLPAKLKIASDDPEDVKPHLFEFLDGDIVSWIEKNLRQPRYYPLVEDDWDLYFGSMMWCIWTRRNRIIFIWSLWRMGVYCSDSLDSLMKYVWRWQEDSNGGLIGCRRRVEVLSVRLRLLVGCSLIRMVRGILQRVSRLVEESCAIIWGMAYRLFKVYSYCSVFDKELWGIYMGLCVAWDRNYRRIIVESDNKEVITLLHSKIEVGRFSPVLLHIRALISREWQLSYQFVPREGNKVAHGSTKLAWSSLAALALHEEVPDELWLEIEEDSRGIV